MKEVFGTFSGSPQYCDICHLPHQHGISITNPEGDALISVICQRCVERIVGLEMMVACRRELTSKEEWGWYVDWLEGELERKRFSEVGAVIAKEIATAKRNAKP